ncbi:MAG: CapA family protein [Bacillota bacterium]|nr:CapA family protein [Bacillota bacterium]
MQHIFFKKKRIILLLGSFLLVLGLIYIYYLQPPKQTPTVAVVTPKEDKKETISLVATGDILMHNTVIWSGRSGQDYNYDHLFAPVKHIISSADYASVCLESAIAGPAAGFTGYPTFNSPDQLAPSLKASGFNLIATASNHCLDRGYKGAERTIKILQEAGLDTIGTYTSLEESQKHFIRDIRGVKVGYLAYTYGTNGIPIPENRPFFIRSLDKETIVSDIVNLRPTVDVLIVILHWGVEYSPFPTEKQREMAKIFFENGADALIGSHPHVIQPSELMNINGKDHFVIYSMGNSIGHQHGVERNSGVIVRLNFTKNFNTNETNMSKVEFYPTFSHPYYDNGKQKFRVIPIDESLQAVESGEDPFLTPESARLLKEIAQTTREHLNDLNKP